MDLSSTVRPDSGANAKVTPWTVLVADDEPEVHEVTRLVLDDFQFEGRSLQILDAHDSEQAYALLQKHPDTAVLLLDVVMESEQAGLHLVERVRNELCNPFVRIVLRTGQPGQAPERAVVAAYDINDYKEKTELTADKLTTTLIATLRAYRDMRTIELQRLGLENVIEASSQLFMRSSQNDFNATLLEQFRHLLGPATQALCCRVEATDSQGPADVTIAAGIGPFEDLEGRDPNDALPQVVIAAMHDVLRDKTHLYTDDYGIFYFAAPDDSLRTLFVVMKLGMQPLDRQLLWLFGTNAAIAYDNLYLHNDLMDSQLEMVYLLASAAETRSSETANHVQRVGLLAEMLARNLGLDATFCEQLRHAAPLHDIGKIGIPDPILNKRGAHTEDERHIMNSHAEIGERMLIGSRRPILRLAAEVARNHHENWDGSGYPTGRKGADIPISGRITMVADVFDALGSRRCYKQAWSEDAIREYMDEQSGRKLDPLIVECLFAHWDEAIEIRHRYPDHDLA